MIGERPFSPYIHQYADHASLKFAGSVGPDIPFNKIKQVLELQIPNMKDVQNRFSETSESLGFSNSEKFFKEFGKTIENSFGKNQNSDLNLLFSGSQIKSDSNKSVQKLTQEVKENVNNLNAVIKKLNEFMGSLEKFVSTKDYKKIVTNATISSYKGGNNFLNNYEHIRQLRENFAIGGLISTKNGSLSGNFNNLLGQKVALERLLQQIDSKERKIITKKQSEIITHAISSAIVQAASLSGLIMEGVKAQQIEQNIPDIIKDVFDNSTHLTVSQTGTKNTEKSSGIKSTSKGDVEIIIDKDTANIKVNIPMSIKHTSYNFGQKGELSIQSGSSIRNVLKAINVDESSFEYQGILNMILWGGKGSGAHAYDANSRTQTLNLIRKANIVNALAGNLKGSDFAYYFVVNNKVFTTKDIIQKILENQSENYLSGAIQAAKGQEGLTKLREPSDNDRANWFTKGAELMRKIQSLHFNTKLKMNIFNSIS